MKKTYHFKQMLSRLLVMLLIMTWTLGANAQNNCPAFDQAANKMVLNDVTWINSNLQQTKSIYYEGMAVPQRIVLTNLTGGPNYKLRLNVEATKSGKNAYDFLTSWDYAYAAAEQIVSGKSLLNQLFDKEWTSITAYQPAEWATNKRLITTDNTVASGSANTSRAYQANQKKAAFDAWFAAHPSTISGRNSADPIMYGDAAINSATLKYVQDQAGAAYYELSFNTSGTSVIIEIAGHLAAGDNSKYNGSSLSGSGWTTGNGAGSISGSPFHFKLTDILANTTVAAFTDLTTGTTTTSLGSRDNQIATVYLPNDCGVDATVSVDNASICQGSTATVTFTGLGSNPPYTFTYSNDNGLTTKTISSSGTNASVTLAVTSSQKIILIDVTSSNGTRGSKGCTAPASGEVNITVNPLPAAPTANNVNACFDNNPHTATATAGAGETIVWYAASTGTTAASAPSGTAVGTYTAYAASRNNTTGCEGPRVAVSVTINPNPSASTSVTNVKCYNGSDGAINLTITSGTSPYTISWTGPSSYSSSTQNITGLKAGTYNYTVTDNKTCQATGSASVTQPAAALSASSTKVDVSCYGGSTGSVDASVSGGTTPYTYSWSNGAITQDISSVVAGSYTLTVTDANGCTATTSATVGQPAAALNASSTKVDVSCYGGSTGSVDASVSGGTTPYTYSWSNGAITQDISSVVAGSYTLTVTDANGCTTTTSATVGQPAAALSASSTKVDVSCYGGSTGSVDASVSGGTTPYTYSWSNGAITQDISSVVAGSYTLTVTDANGCTTTTSATVGQPAAALSASSTKVDVSCYGGSTGSVDASVSGGTTPYTYSWSNGAITQDISSVVAGSYTLTVTDANGCTTTTSATVGQPAAALSASSTKVDVSCYGGSTGSVDASVSGGTTPYTYSWSNGAITQDISSVVAGSYTLTVTDANGCTTTTSATVGQPAAALSASSTKVDVSCYGGSTGSVDASVSGGTTPYTYSWSNGAITQDISSVVAGSYTLTVTDANGCTTTTSATVGQPAAALSASSTKVDVSCYGGSTGSVDASVSGGTTPYTYSWSNGAITQDISSVVAGSYTLTVTDANGCTTTTSATVGQPAAALSATITSSTDVSCNGKSDGAIVLNITGGTEEYGIAWDGPAGYESSDNNISGLKAGEYTIHVTDAHGCTATDKVTIGEPDEVTLTASATDVVCNGEGNGKISISGTNGTKYVITSSEQTVDQGNVAGYSSKNWGPGTYTVTVSIDGNQEATCSTSKDVTIIEPEAITITPTPTPADCKGAKTGSVTVVATGGRGDFKYTIGSTTNTTGIFTGLGAGIYTVTVVDENGTGCPNTASVTIEDGPICYPTYTFSQGFFGNYNGKSCVFGEAKTKKEFMMTALNNSDGNINNSAGQISLGTNFKIVGSFNNASQVIDNVLALMPGGGTPVSMGLSADINLNQSTASLLADLRGRGFLNNNSRIANTLFGQTIAMWFSINIANQQYSNDLGKLDLAKGCKIITAEPTSNGTCGGVSSATQISTSIPQSVIDALIARGGTTVKDLVDLAGEALTVPAKGAKTYTYMTGKSIALVDLNTALDALVNAFHTGKFYVRQEACAGSGGAQNSAFSNQVETTAAVSISAGANAKAESYPNPFTDKISFRLTAKQTAKSTLVLYNMMGQKVATVFEGQMQANTQQTIIYNVPAALRKNMIFVFQNGTSTSTGKVIGGVK